MAALGFRLKKRIAQIVSKQLEIEDFVHELWQAAAPVSGKYLGSGVNLYFTDQKKERKIDLGTCVDIRYL